MLPDNPKGSHQGSTLLGNCLLWASPLIALLVGWIGNTLGGLELPAALTLAIATWTALWWIFEAVPIPVASLIPLAFLPMLGVLSPQTVGQKYGHPLVLLLLGGFLLSKAMEKSGAHKRIA
ncbi:MAG: SLC13/DASS family transporter, partial [Flavobacteriia bacterium]|nr:SLC13/DASS family transporter [Flavobacteriia bacterium]